MGWTDDQYRDFLVAFGRKISNTYPSTMINGKECFILPNNECVTYTILHPQNDEIFFVIERADDENAMKKYDTEDCETYCISDFNSVEEMEAIMMKDLREN